MKKGYDTKANIVGKLFIILLIIVLGAVIYFGANFLRGDSGEGGTGDKLNGKLSAPDISLKLSTTEEGQEKVKILVNVTTEDEDGLKFIELPDGTQVYVGTTEYEVDENGKYEFIAYGTNGESSKKFIEVKNIIEPSAMHPYVPDGFEHVTGTVEEGYVIQDIYGNQYVWIPVETGMLVRTTLTDGEYEDSDSTTTGLVNSVAKNYGYYISRYEASAYQADGNRFAGSVQGQIPWTNIAYQDAKKAAENTAKALQYPKDIVTALPSSHAWDTVLSWIDTSITNYSTNTSYGNYSGTIFQTGGTESDIVNNICDLAGNVREWTTETYKEKNSNNRNEEYIKNKVVRGGCAHLNHVANSRIGYPENLTDEYWGFRVMLYKNT